MMVGNFESSALRGMDIHKHTDEAILHCNASLMDPLVTSLGLLAEAQNLVLHLTFSCSY